MNHQLAIALGAIGLLIVVLNNFQKRIQRSVLSTSMLAACFGILLGPQVFDLLDVSKWGKTESVMETITLFSLNISLMTTALKIPDKYFREHTRTLFLLLLVVMPLMLLICAFIFKVIFDFEWTFAFLIAAIITPTDPIIAATIVSSEKAEKVLPGPTRNAIYGDSGINDGLAMPFVLLALYFFIDKPDLWKEWALKIVLWKSVTGIALGLLAGWLAGKALEWAIVKKLTTHAAVLAYSVSVALFVLGSFELLKLNSIIAVFAAGVMMRRAMARQEDVEEEQIQSMLERLFFVPVFVFFGLVIPWNDWLQLGWKAIAMVAAVLVFRRLPFMLLIRRGFKDLTAKDAAFIGWFGPVGGAAMYYAFYCIKHSHNHEIWTYTSLVIFASVVIHGATAYPFIRWYEKKSGG